MEFIDVEGLPEEQLFVIRARVDGKSYREIQKSWDTQFHTFLSMDAITTCITRGAIGFPWNKGMKGGDRPYLCPCDMKRLSDTIRNSAASGAQLDATDVVDEAARLKLERSQKGLQFLKQTNSPHLAVYISSYVSEVPSRTWLNGVLDELDAAIKSRRMIDPKRLAACSKKLLQDYFFVFGDLIKGVPKASFLVLMRQ